MHSTSTNHARISTTDLSKYATSPGAAKQKDSAQRSIANAKTYRVADQALEQGLALSNVELSFAACAELDALGIDPEVFFPVGRDDPEADLQAAQSVCAACPLAQRCLAYGRAISADGVWGGQLLKAGRDDMLKKAGRPPKARLVEPEAALSA